MAAQGQEMAPQRTTVMTIGALSRRTGVPVKILREYEDLGLIYTVGRSPGNYRLFDDEALWCVQTIGGLRGLGLTLKEIQALASTYLNDRGEPIGPRLARLLGAAPTRTEDRIAELGELLQRIDRYEAEHQAELAGLADLGAQDPCRRE